MYKVLKILNPAIKDGGSTSQNVVAVISYKSTELLTMKKIY